MKLFQMGIGPLLPVLLLALLATGCQTYQEKSQGSVEMWRQGNFQGAIKEFSAKAKDSGKADAVVWRLEEGAVLRAGLQYKESNDAFQLAEDAIAWADEQPKVSVSRETAAIFSNQATLPYTGRDYDRVMLNAYKAVNYLQLNQPDNARTELIRAYQRQQEAVANNEKRIAAKQDKLAVPDGAQPNDPEVMTEKAQADPKFQGALSSNYSQLNQLQPYAEYVNPFVVYLDAIYFMTASTGASDLERANKSFERVQGLAGDNKFISQDLATMRSVLAGGDIPPTVYVLFETGRAPIREQIRIDIPVFVVGRGNVPYVGAAFPVLAPQGDYLPSITASAAGLTESTVTLASMDRVVGQAFKDELPSIITKTVISTVAKAAASYAINKSAEKQDPLAGLFSKVLTTVAQAAINIADTRTWTTLPKEIQFCRLPRPADGKLTIAGAAGFPKADLTLDNGSVHLILVKSTSASSPMIVSQIKLK